MGQFLTPSWLNQQFVCQRLDQKGRIVGYKLHLVFDPSEKYDRKVFVKKLIESGAVICDDPAYPGGYILLPELAGVLLFDHEETIRKGHWAYLRPPESFEGLKKLLETARQIGGRLYDPQRGTFVTEETLAETLACIGRFQAMIGGLLGRTKEEDK
jgi:hypothetical protein